MYEQLSPHYIPGFHCNKYPSVD